MSERAVRPATLADVTEIAMIHVRSWQAAYRGLMPQDYLDGLDPAARAALMSATLANLAAAGYRDATQWVLQDNARARRFYSQAGWAADGAAQTDDLDGFPLLEVRYRRPLP